MADARAICLVLGLRIPCFANSEFLFRQSMRGMRGGTARHRGKSLKTRAVNSSFHNRQIDAGRRALAPLDRAAAAPSPLARTPRHLGGPAVMGHCARPRRAPRGSPRRRRKKPRHRRRRRTRRAARRAARPRTPRGTAPQARPAQPPTTGALARLARDLPLAGEPGYIALSAAPGAPSLALADTLSDVRSRMSSRQRVEGATPRPWHDSSRVPRHGAAETLAGPPQIEQLLDVDTLLPSLAPGEPPNPYR